MSKRLNYHISINKLRKYQLELKKEEGFNEFLLEREKNLDPITDRHIKFKPEKVMAYKF